MNCTTKFAVPVPPDCPRRISPTESERFASQVKLAGVLILLILDLIVIAVLGPAP